MDTDYKSVSIVDLRSDTLTKPSREMREAMMQAEVGDDVYEEDPTVIRLEREAARLVGTQNSLFVCSGTMANLIAIMNHCDVRGCEAYCSESCHCILHEQSGASQIGGVSLRSLRSNSDGTFDIDELRSKLRQNRDYEPISKLVIVENPINGKILPLKWLQDLVAFCKQHNLKIHMDGARLFNASVALEVPANEIVNGFDSVSFCLSKGLGAPVGSLICGNRQFVANSRRIRKVLGGGLRQVGVLAAAGILALKNVEMLREDHLKAESLATAVNEINSRLVSVDLNQVQTNMVFIKVDSNFVDAKNFVALLQSFDEDEDEIVSVKCMALNDSTVRLVLHLDISADDLNLAIRKIRKVIRKLDESTPKLEKLLKTRQKSKKLRKLVKNSMKV